MRSFLYNKGMFHSVKKKQIILVRHAKAVDLIDFKWTDFERPLSDRGQNLNKIFAKYLRLIGIRPDRIVSCPSLRTKMTAIELAEQYKITKVEYFDELYNGDESIVRNSEEIYLKIIQKTKVESRSMMIVGHNSDLTNIAKFLTWDGIPMMKKWSIVVLSVPETLEWKDINKSTLDIVYYLTPHFLRMEDLV